ncbi:hypothetical protein [Nocardiopsis trehalosi]|jgi:hypothetical protein|uniref:hypothetical protein n=1 Tax=Nocardiopsis trehalosi TaxID=109329 RepID=UPI00082DC4A0|nr:hypothetical protein [Nocardiopsis trehalosi]
MKKFTAAGIIAGAALSAMFMGAPAYADGANSGDQQFNQNLQVVPIVLCNTEVNVIAVPIDILSPNTTGDCGNGDSSVNVKKTKDVEIEK